MYQLKVNQQQSIIALFERSWSRQRIARELAWIVAWVENDKALRRQMNRVESELSNAKM